ncbi:chitinase, putative [Entamoeba invadens IP1]|uniref:Chitinase domain-containing protein 1 n=1 Tax=Entamoeba invadens IP1 TaxID=370355 RepID=A0A0A1U5Q2_ENTIV|nr:chitinase, putative [Entamoeba invadens IP1]ELP88190.1 chitinase, putative [Entamoeba invadens IP1]|eukprot:XP_004254961.1 chitinase, putative [Entamoeba invadens IP1]
MILFYLLFQVLSHPLLKKSLNKEEILSYNITETTPKHFKNTLLGFVTPWNLHGLSALEKNKHKIDIASPVLYTVSFIDGHYKIRGDDELKIDGYPRYSFESVEQPLDVVGKLIKEHCKAHNYKGLVVDGVFSIYSHFRKQATDQLILLFKELDGLDIIIAVHPFSYFTYKEVEATKKYVKMYVVMTYDYFNPNQNKNTFNAPIDFIDKAMKSLGAKGPQFAIGINFYGYAFCNGRGKVVVDRKSYFDWLKMSYGQIKWHDEEEEHTFISQDCVVNYPTLLYLKKRIDYAELYNYSISIWELGQGLDYFLDVF